MLVPTERLELSYWSCRLVPLAATMCLSAAVSRAERSGPSSHDGVDPACHEEPTMIVNGPQEPAFCAGDVESSD